MLDIYVTIRYKTLEVMILDRDVLCKRLYFRSNHEWDCPFIISVKCDWILENTAQHLRAVSLKIKYGIDLIQKTEKGKTYLMAFKRAIYFASVVLIDISICIRLAHIIGQSA